LSFATVLICDVILSHVAVDRHVGDLGNFKADYKGKVFMKFQDKKVSLHGINNVIGRTVVVRSLITPSLIHIVPYIARVSYRVDK